MRVHILDYVAGNVRSLVNAIIKLGFEVEWIRSPEDIAQAKILIFPGVGNYGHCLSHLGAHGFIEPLRKYILDGKRFLGICVGFQALFTGSDEDPSASGLEITSGTLKRFACKDKSVPHVGWNHARGKKDTANHSQSSALGVGSESRYYFVHSYALPYSKGKYESLGFDIARTCYGNEEFISAISKDNIFGTQFHPEKSGVAGLLYLDNFLQGRPSVPRQVSSTMMPLCEGLSRRVIACLDVRTNEAGDLVVTKGDQYDVHEHSSSGKGIRNLGKPVDLARSYYEQGADEIVFLNITSFRDCPLQDSPMLEVLRLAAQQVFVPLTVGGGISATIDPQGRPISALEVATQYFKSGADKVSVGTDAVYATEDFLRKGGQKSGKTSIETISAAYGSQAVMVSVDPKRVYVETPEATEHHVIQTSHPNPQGFRYCWYQCTIKGGRESRDIDVKQLVETVAILGAGEILLNCIDRDGSNAGFDLELINDVKASVRIPVIASSGAGTPEHFNEVFAQTETDAALGAGMFHRNLYTVKDVKSSLQHAGFCVRNEYPLIS